MSPDPTIFIVGEVEKMMARASCLGVDFMDGGKVWHQRLEFQ